MLKKIWFENYRCLRQASIDLEPLTVLVGPNASGKGSVLRALEHGNQSREALGHLVSPFDIFLSSPISSPRG